MPNGPEASLCPWAGVEEAGQSIGAVSWFVDTYNEVFPCDAVSLGRAKGWSPDIGFSRSEPWKHLDEGEKSNTRARAAYGSSVGNVHRWEGVRWKKRETGVTAKEWGIASGE